MTKRLKSKHKVDRRLKANLWGRPKSPFNVRAYPPGQHGQNKKGKPTDYGIQLQAKQKLKAYYGNINERQFRNIYRKALAKRGDTTENLIALLESRLDTVIYRAKFAPTVFAARQLINHGHITVNKKKVNISSFSVRDKDTIQVRDKAEEKSHTMRIRDGILETGLEFQTPVLIWEGQDPFGDDEDVRGDGNHTILALLGLKNFNTVKTLRVSREFCEKYNLNLEELRQIGLKMNPRQVVAKRETEDEDVIKQLLGLLEGGTNIDPKKTEYGKEVCKNLGYKGKKPAYLCKKAIKIHKDNILAKSGLKRAIYDEDHPDNLKSLNRKAASLNKDRSIVITGNTAQPSKLIRAILESVTDSIYSDCYNVHLVCHHNGNDNNKKTWESREKSSIESLVKATFDMMAPVVIEEDNGLKHEFARTFTIHEMDHYQSDIS